jgi:hypothetical protein
MPVFQFHVITFYHIFYELKFMDKDISLVYIQYQASASNQFITR